jgi:uncharacterized protein
MKLNYLVIVRLLLLFDVAAGFSDAFAQAVPDVSTNSEVPPWATGDFDKIKAKAEKGDAKSQCVLAEIYYFGLGIPINNLEAAKWFRKSAEQGIAEAQCNLGTMLRDGNGGTKNKTEAVKWFKKAAEQKYAAAEFELGECYSLGIGVASDDSKSVELFTKAANQGEDRAQARLSQAYLSGKGVAKDLNLSFYWAQKSALQGNALGEYGLAIFYYLGVGGAQQDFVQAYKWANLAAAGDLPNSTDVAKIRNDLLSRMTSTQIEEAQRLARAFVPRKNSANDNSTSSENPTATGTGFFITEDGYLISNYHVVKGAAKVRLLTGTGLIDTTVVKVDAANDLALLKAVGAFKPLPIAASRTVKLGATVATVGFPDTGLQGFSPKLAKGEIGSLAGIQDDPRYFQISVPVQPGNSGGALVDARGNVVGIVAAKLSAKAALDATGALPENVNYAVKSSLLLSFLESAPEVAAKLKEPNTKDEPFEDVVKSAQDAAVLVLVY